MDAAAVHERLLELSRQIHKLEDRRAELDEQILAAKQSHLDLLISVTAPSQLAVQVTPMAVNGVSEALAAAVVDVPPAQPRNGVGAAVAAQIAAAQKPRAPWMADGLHVKTRVLKFVAAHAGAVPQERIIEAMASIGIDPKTTEQCCYDMTSSKIGWMARSPAGLALNDAGRQALQA